MKPSPTTCAPEGTKFKMSKAIKSMELFGDLRMRYEYRAAQLGPEAGTYAGGHDTADRWRYALRVGVRGDLAGMIFITDCGWRLRKTSGPLGTHSGAAAHLPIMGPSARAATASILGQAYLGWRPASWLDVSIGRVPQPLYTTPMVWDSDYTPEGAVEKFKYTYGPVDYFATFGQYVYQDVTPTSAAAVQGGSSASGLLNNFSDQNAYLLAWQLGQTYHVDTNLSVKVAPVFYTYVGHGNASAGFYGPFVGQGENGFTFNPNGYNPGGVPYATTTSSGVPGAFVPITVASPPPPARTKLGSIIWPSLNSRWR